MYYYVHSGDTWKASTRIKNDRLERRDVNNADNSHFIRDRFYALDPSLRQIER